jgi:hypothetical protein
MTINILGAISQYYMKIKSRTRDLYNTKILFSVGGLGNQLFILNFAHVLALQYNCRVVIFNNWHLKVPNRPFELDKVLKNCEHEIKVIDNVFFYNFSRLIVKLCVKLKIYRLNIFYYNESNYLSPTRLNSYFLFSSYFQNTSYFPIHPDFIIELSHTINNLSPEKSLLAITSEQFQCVHLRRGDYLEHKHTFGVLETRYFISQIRSDVPCLVASEEEPVFFRDFLASKSKIILLPEQISSWELLYVFSKAKFFFGSNSSLSFWAAKMVSMNKGFATLPSEWFKNNPLYLPNLYDKEITYLQPIWAKD